MIRLDSPNTNIMPSDSNNYTKGLNNNDVMIHDLENGSNDKAHLNDWGEEMDTMDNGNSTNKKNAKMAF